MFLLNDLPNENTLAKFKGLYPEMDITATSAFLRLLKVGSIYLDRLDRFLTPYGLTHGRWMVMVLLKRNDNMRATPTDLAHLQGITKATVSGLLRALEADGYVRRISSLSDKRSQEILLTQKGVIQLDTVMHAYYPFINEMMAALDENTQKDLTLILNNLLA